MKKIFSLFLLAFVFSVGTMTAQVNVIRLDGDALQAALKQNIKNGQKQYENIFYMQVIKTNEISVAPSKIDEMLLKLKAIPSVFEATYDPSSHTLRVMNKPQITKVPGEQIKAVIVPYGFIILGYEEYFYKTN